MKTRIIERRDPAWDNRDAERCSTVREHYFRDGRPSGFSGSGDGTEYAEALLSIMKVEPQWTVLDVACADGALAVALAGQVKAVTAVDFSGNMLEILRDRCREKSISNVKPVHGRWEDDWSALGIGPHDVAVASRSIRADDVLDSAVRLNQIARKQVYITVAVGDGPFDRAVYESTGRKLNMGPSYTYIYYNLLYQRMGILANISFIREVCDNAWDSRQEALEGQRWMFCDLTPEEEEKLKAHLDQQLVYTGGRWRLPYDRECRWAVMWWDKE